MSRPLFRKEALDAQREKFLGQTSAARPVPLWVFTLLALGSALLLIAVATWGQYTRRERVQGYLASQLGTVPLLVSAAGQVKEVVVREGAIVKAGDPIARVTVDRTNSSAASSSDAVLHELAERHTLLENERQQTGELGKKQVEQAQNRVRDLDKEVADADQSIVLQRTRLKSAEEVAARYEDLAKKQFLSEVAARQRQDDVTDQQIKLQGLVRERASLEKDLEAARLDIPTDQLKTEALLQQLDRQISELKQNSAEEALLRETVIRAPIAGTVTNITVSSGSTVASNTPLATIIPENDKVQAELLVPTRAIGFLRPGLIVQLRYEAFPYERFGQFGGVVESVGGTVFMQGERVGPLSLKDPAYRIIVKLDDQAIHTSGQTLALRPGMLVSGDLLLEKRTLLEWIFQPVLQLRERLR